MRLRTRIASSYTILLVAGVVLVSTISSWQITNYLDEANGRTLADQADLFARLIESGTLTVDSTGRSDGLLRDAARAVRIRVTIIRRDGVVLFDSSILRDSLRQVENHGQRPEVAGAQRGGAAFASRRSATTGEEYLYAARMVHGGNDPALTGGVIRAAVSLAEIRSITSRVQFTIWTIGLCTIILILAFSVQIARRITKPILEIATTAAAIRDGDLRQRITVTTDDEIGSLGVAINEMAERLSADIERLTKLEHVRSQFLGNVSHELRTPIFSIQGFLETLLDGAVDDPAVNRSFLEKAHKHAMRLNSLLNDLIDISRIESGEMKMSFRYFGVQEFLEQMAEEVRPAVQARQLTFTLESALERDAKALGDRERLHQVISNLVANAIKYTDAPGSVVLRCILEADHCRIEVQDSGCGIEAEHHSRIFERFYRVDKDRSRDVGGTGLGLAIVKHIVEAHGGTIGVRSTVGTGSTFFFTIKR